MRLKFAYVTPRGDGTNGRSATPTTLAITIDMTINKLMHNIRSIADSS
jgi:hypothetical protein